MYSDPSNIRDNIFTLRMNDVESDLITAVNNFTGGQRSTLMRELVLRGAAMVLAGELDITTPREAREVSYVNQKESRSQSA